MVSSRSMPAFLSSRNGQQLLSLSYITKIFFKVNRLRTIEEKSPNHQHIALFLFLSHLQFCNLTDDHNNEKPPRDGQNIFLDPWIT